MKRLCLLICLLMMPLLVVVAQKNLHVNAIFEGKIIPKNRMVETLAKGESLEQYRLSYFRSVKMNVTDMEYTSIYELVTKDVGMETLAEDMEYGRDNDKASYFILHLPKQQKLERYLCYQCYEASRGGKNITLVYIEGKASMKELKKMFKKK